MESAIYLLILTCLTARPASSDQSQPAQSPASRAASVRLDRGDLSVVFRDNSQSPAVLSGIAELMNRHDAPGFNAYDTDSPGASAGLNFEHIISGHKDDHNAFSPRGGPYMMTRLPDGASVILERRAEDDPWSIASTMKYTLTPPHFIDMEFRCTPRDAKRFDPGGYAALFWANYMNDVIDPALHFRGVAKRGEPETWITADAPKGPADWNGGGTYRHVRADPLAYGPDHNFKLNVWSYDEPRFTLPFYYGRAAHDMVFIIMFDRAWTPADEIRFSLFKFKLKRFPRPAWDFQYVIHHVEADKPYGFKARVVWKKFVSPEDCLNEYKAWRRTGSAP